MEKLLKVNERNKKAKKIQKIIRVFHILTQGISTGIHSNAFWQNLQSDCCMVEVKIRPGENKVGQSLVLLSKQRQTLWMHLRFAD